MPACLQVNMSEAAMPQTVLCVATPRLAREMLRKEGAYEGATLHISLLPSLLPSGEAVGRRQSCLHMSLISLPLLSNR